MPGENPFAFTPTPLIALEHDQPRQVCRVTLPDGLTSDARLELQRDGATLAWSGDALHRDLLLPEVSAPTTGVATLASGEDTWSTTVEFAPVRRWSVFLVNHSHTDIGFTHPYLDCIDIHVKNLRLALDMIDATAEWPGDSRMRWTVESAWQVQHFLRAFPQDLERLASAIREGLVEIEALYIHSYFDILSREQLVRSLSLASNLRQEMDIPITSAMICDVPGCAWSLVDLFAAEDVRYLAIAPNNFIAPFHAQTSLERPFIWQGPAGGRVLVWFTGDPSWAYIEGARLGFWESFDSVVDKLPARLLEMEAAGYPYDAVQFQLGSDNRPLRLFPATIAREWNATYLSPRIEIATTSQFFQHMEARYSDRFPVVSGEWQSSWSETSLHYPHEAALSRRNHHTLAEWERFATIANWKNEAYIPPLKEIDDAYDASLLFDEHGGSKGIWLPRNDDETLEALIQGYALFEQETKPAIAGRAKALAAATGAQRTADDPVAVVWNLLPWPRSGPVEITAPGDVTVTHAVDEVTGQPVPFTTTGDGRTLLHAGEVPPFGFRRFRLSGADAETPPWPEPVPEHRVEDERASLQNDWFALEVDSVGAITSLVLRETGSELIDREGWPGGNALTRYQTEPAGPEPGGDFNADRRLYDGIPIDGWIVAPTTVEPEPIAVTSEPDSTTVRTHVTIDGVYGWESNITLHRDWIECRNRLVWLGQPLGAEMLYVVFPFAMDQPEIRHASQYAIVDPKRQTLSGSNHDYFAVQGWTDFNVHDAGITIVSVDLPMVDYGGINLRRFHRKLDPERGVFAFRAAALGNAPAEPGSPWGKLPWLELRFAVRPYAGAFDPLAAHRFGEEQDSPLVASCLPPRHPGEWRQSSASLVSLESESALVTGLKPATNGRGSIVRLWESTGRRTTARLSFPQHGLLAAWRTTPTERDIGRLAIAGNSITLELEPFQVVTLRCVVGR
jgi:hypothetical protein